MKEISYKKEINEFKKVLSKIGDEHGWTLSDIKERFSNDVYDRLIFEDVPDTAHGLQTTLVAAEKVPIIGLESECCTVLILQQKPMNITASAVEALESI